MSSELYHHGILGQKWDVRRYQNKDGSLTPEGRKRYSKSYKSLAESNLEKADSYNLDKWGTDSNHNVLYIIGMSGSGKSTTARGLSNKNDSIIHLDYFLNKIDRDSKYFNKDFDNFLKQKGIDPDKASIKNKNYKNRFKTIDSIGDQIENYGKHCFNNGRRVIIEGVQMGDDTIFPDKNYFKNRPVVLLNSDYNRDVTRAGKRDGITVSQLEKELNDTTRRGWFEYIQSNMNKIAELNQNSIDNGKKILNNMVDI